MKYFFLILTLLASPLLAGSYTLTTTAPQDTALTRAMNRANAATCKYWGQTVGCTQAQARREFCRRAGFGGVTTCTDPANPATCTTTPLVAVCDGSNQVDVFTDVPTFLQREVVNMVRDTYSATSIADDKAAFQAALDAANQAKKDAACVALGLLAGCL
jgi:hypothetical protein